MRSFYSNNEKEYYCETLEEVQELAAKLPEGAIIYMLTDELTAYMVKSDHTPVEI